MLLSLQDMDRICLFYVPSFCFPQQFLTANDFCLHLRQVRSLVIFTLSFFQIKEHLIDNDDTWSEGTDANRIPVLVEIIKDVLASKKGSYQIAFLTSSMYI